MKVYIVTGSENNGCLYAPFVFLNIKSATKKMEELVK